MEGYYTIAQIASKVKRSKQAIYKLLSNNKDLESILPENTILVGRGKQYSKFILDWIKDYYSQIEDTSNEKEAEEESTEATPKLDPVEVALLKQEIENLKEKLAIAEKLVEDSKAEKQELYQQNGALLLLLAQEKKEKQLFLEAPKEKTGFFSGLFGRRKKERDSNE